MNSILPLLLIAPLLLAACSETPLQPTESRTAAAPVLALESSGKPDPIDPPFYARLERGSEPVHSDEWAAIVFYRQPACVRPAFNLLDFFDIPAAFGCSLTVTGFEIFKEPLPTPPIHVKFEGLGAVPIWFVSWPHLQAAMADDVVTVGELQGIPSRVVGSASLYHETLHPAELLVITAQGVLTDGRRFSLQATYAHDGTLKQVRIAFR
jgi:hypothetical protein